MRPDAGWKWYDPGNWCYATVWFLVRKLSRNRATQCEHARHLHLAMNECETRWPRQGAHFWELVGDLFEASLSHGYRETAREHVVHSLSIVCYCVLAFKSVLDTNNPPHNRRVPISVSPYHFADALLCAHAAHKFNTGALWARFYNVVSNDGRPQPARPTPR